jgi:hypothetical protein
LKSSGKAAVGRRIVDEDAILGGRLGLGVGRRGGDLAVRHPGAFEKLGGIFGLVEEEAVAVAMNFRSEEVP